MEKDIIIQSVTGPVHVIDGRIPQFSYRFERGWTVSTYDVQSIVVWPSENLCLYQSQRQLQKDGLEGTELMKELRETGYRRLSAVVLDYLLEHQEIIPQEWRGSGKVYLFPGITYADETGLKFIRTLYWNGNEWQSHHVWVENVFGGNYVSLLLKD